VGRWVEMRITDFKFIGEKVDGEKSTFNLNILVSKFLIKKKWGVGVGSMTYLLEFGRV
jgi:hypothetical protein